MGLAMIATLSAFVGMFIVFRVVTPESRPVDVRPQRVVILNPNEPAERALIHQAMDRSFGIIPTEVAATAPVKGLKTPDFVPSYARRELRLRPLPAGLTASNQTRPFALEVDVLPPLPEPPAQVASAAPASRLQAVIEGDLKSRITQAVIIPDVPLADATRPRFQVAVGALGQVLMALPLSVSDDAEINQKLHHAVTQMRFAPAAADMAWGQVSFEWVKEAAKP